MIIHHVTLVDLILMEIRLRLLHRAEIKNSLQLVKVIEYCDKIEVVVAVLLLMATFPF
jgi:hypothetical protein